MKLVLATLLLIGILTALFPLSSVLRIAVGLLVAVLAVTGFILESRTSIEVE